MGGPLVSAAKGIKNGLPGLRRGSRDDGGGKIYISGGTAMRGPAVEKGIRINRLEEIRKYILKNWLQVCRGIEK
jgi:hypothetical protein